MPIESRGWRWVTLAAALLLLNFSLTFGNVWPTPAIRWRSELSLELAAALVLLALIGPRARATVARLIGVLASIWLLLVVGHYVDVTAAALFGRDLNLYWDARFVPDVAAMLMRAAPIWLTIGVVLAFAIAGWALHVVLRWGLRRVLAGATDSRVRVALAVTGGLVLALFASQRLVGRVPAYFATPVTEAYGHQAALAARAVAGRTALAPSPPMASDLSRLDGGDVYLIFLESYGAVSFDRASLRQALAPGRARLEAAVRETGRQVVSTFVESPTFGGSSWLAHISLMSGLEVREPDTNALLMTEKRETLVKAFSRRGYRTIALMPGLRLQWPEGGFYGFDEIYGRDRLGYEGPPFGWFMIPDQFALARFDQIESDRPSAPTFVFFPTISTHTPFRPTPPYQPEWRRMLTPQPFDEGEMMAAYEREPDWLDFDPSYADALTYSYDVLAGYLRQHPSRNLALILLGDHQPPALVSGEWASWDVPVHVIASSPELLARLRARGFGDGVTPQRERLGPMHGLLTALLDAFGDP